MSSFKIIRLRVLKKKSLKLLSLVKFIFYFWSFEISRNILRNQIIIGSDSYSKHYFVVGYN